MENIVENIWPKLSQHLEELKVVYKDTRTAEEMEQGFQALEAATAQVFTVR